MSTLVDQLVDVAADLHELAKSFGDPKYQHTVLPDIGPCRIDKQVPQRELQALYNTRNVSVSAALLYLTFSPLFNLPPKISIDGIEYRVIYTRRDPVEMYAIVTPVVLEQGPPLF
jgi:hypothetical protein